MKEIKKKGGYLNENIPVLYQYMSSENGKKLLENSKVLVKNPTSFNDPFDCHLGLINFDSISQTKIKKSIEKFNNNNQKAIKKINFHNLNDVEIKTILEQVIQKFVKTIGIACYSEYSNSMLMWSHYTNSHKGICFGFDKMKFYSCLKDNSPSNISLIKVDYTDNYKSEDFFKDYELTLYNWISTKSKCWKYEKEIRILFTNINYTNKDGEFIKFNIESISEIYLGSEMDSNDQEYYINFCKEKIPNATIYKMTKLKNSFKLLPKLIN